MFLLIHERVACLVSNVSYFFLDMFPFVLVFPPVSVVNIILLEDFNQVFYSVYSWVLFCDEQVASQSFLMLLCVA